ncbi:hypothetical protein [Alteromonas sp. a30]|uniref:hypothetical protein n=1 Tax=Alteromonas sp. a30 TaxID=2730917 RepID=UPI00227DC9AE|nr:hypothetical protein [Alteromonas sp. a30]MCY7297179.1 hypothetical protein [Alteromonas sp. a30]
MKDQLIPQELLKELMDGILIQFQETIDTQLNPITEKISSLEERFSSIEKRFSSVEEQLDSAQKQTDKVERQLSEKIETLHSSFRENINGVHQYLSEAERQRELANQHILSRINSIEADSWLETSNSNFQHVFTSNQSHSTPHQDTILGSNNATTKSRGAQDGLSMFASPTNSSRRLPVTDQ